MSSRLVAVAGAIQSANRCCFWFKFRCKSTHKDLNSADQDRLDAIAFRRLLDHLALNTDVQNIDLMILAGFCRNCLSKWYKAAADGAGLDISMNEARERTYGMPYDEWKNLHQKEATREQLAALEARRGSKV